MAETSVRRYASPTLAFVAVIAVGLTLWQTTGVAAFFPLFIGLGFVVFTAARRRKDAPRDAD